VKRGAPQATSKELVKEKKRFIFRKRITQRQREHRNIKASSSSSFPIRRKRKNSSSKSGVLQRRNGGKNFSGLAGERKKKLRREIRHRPENGGGYEGRVSGEGGAG